MGEAQSYVNFGLYGAPGLLDREEILGMAEEGAWGLWVGARLCCDYSLAFSWGAGLTSGVNERGWGANW